MTAIRLTKHNVEKPWGRTDLAGWDTPDGQRIGEIWFEPPTGSERLPLLVKYIFTSEKLSIQVHPDDAQAQAQGLAGGKSECWYILDAEPDARLGIGLTRALTGDELREAALDGSIEGLMDWKPVQAGSFYYIPAGTVHAIGAGVTLVEVQQNNDVTYRLYDYGRPRELHLDQGIAVSDAQPYAGPDRIVPMTHDGMLVSGPDRKFTLAMIQQPAGAQRHVSGERHWFIPLAGSGTIAGQRWQAGECWLIEGDADISADSDSSAMLAY